MNNTITLFLIKLLLLAGISIPFIQNSTLDDTHSNTIHSELHSLSTKDHLALKNSRIDTLNIEIEKIIKTEEEWKQQLSSTEYRILRKKGTELPFVNDYWDNKEDGIYYCKACGLPLFNSKAKYKSGTGWPSFWEPIDKKVVEEREDNSYFMTRTEIVCARCGSHIGHVFEDGPAPTGLRYCMNSTAMKFESSETQNQQKND